MMAKITRKRVLSLLMTLVLAFSLLPVSALASPPAPPPGGGGGGGYTFVTVTVIDRSTGEGISHAYVRASDGDLFEFADSYTDYFGRATLLLKTGKDYTFSVSADGYNDNDSETLHVNESAGGRAITIYLGDSTITLHETSQAVDSETYGKTGLKIMYVDVTDPTAETVISAPSSLNTTWTFDSLTDDKTVDGTVFPAPSGYRFENAYFYWSGQYSGTKRTVTAFKLHNNEALGNGGLKYASDIIFQTSGGSTWYGYNPTGVLRIACTRVANYTASFDLNYDGLHGSSNPYTSGQTVLSGSTITEPVAPTRGGYQFNEWEFWDTTLDTPAFRAWDFDTDVVTRNVTLYATWTELPDPTYTVNYHWVTGYGTPANLPDNASDIDADNADSYQLASVPAQTSGYTLPTGWYTADANPTDGSTTYSGEVDLTALDTDDDYVVDLYAYCLPTGSVNITKSFAYSGGTRTGTSTPTGFAATFSVLDASGVSKGSFTYEDGAFTQPPSIDNLPYGTYTICETIQQAGDLGSSQTGSYTQGVPTSTSGTFSEDAATTAVDYTASVTVEAATTTVAITNNYTYVSPTQLSISYAWTDDSVTAPEGLSLPATLVLTPAVTTSGLCGVPSVTFANYPGYHITSTWMYKNGSDEYVNVDDSYLATMTAGNSYTLYARLTYDAPMYKIVGEYYHTTDSVNETSDMATGVNSAYASVPVPANVTDVSQITDAAVLGNCTAEMNTYNSQSGYTKDSVIGHTGSLSDNNLVYTVKYIRNVPTVGSIHITAGLTGLDANNFTNARFAVLNSENVAVGTFTYAQVTANQATVNGLRGGTEYTVKEINTAVPGYNLNTVRINNELFDLTAGDPNTTVTVTAGVTSTVNFDNTYTSKTFTVNFVVENGQVHDGTYDIGGVYTRCWTPIDGSEEYDWFGNLDSSDTAVSKLTYTFNMGQYLNYEDDGLTFDAPGITPAAGYNSTSVQYRNGETAFTSFNDTMTALLASDDPEPSITFTATCTASTNTPYYVRYEYQMPNGDYTTGDGQYTYVDPYTGTTGETVTIPNGDPRLSPVAGHGITGKTGLTYVLDTAATTDSERSKTIAGDGSTTLRVFFKWQQGVTYQYNGATAAILAAHPLPTDSARYDCGAATTNTGAANGTQYTSAAGNTWELRWDQQSAPMTDSGVTYTGTWTYAAKGQASVTVQYVDEHGNLLRESDMKTDDYETPYDFASAQNVTYISSNGYYYTFSADYAGQFSANHADEDVSSYAGTIPTSNLTITRVYNTVTAPVQVIKNYTGIQTLPSDFYITVSDGMYMGDSGSVTLALSDGTVDTANRTVTWTVEVPVGVECIYTENNCSNGAYWSYVLTAQQSNGRVSNEGYNYKTLTVSNNNSVRATVNQLNEMPKAMFNRLSEGYYYDNQIILTNAYTYSYIYYGGGGGGDDDDTPTPVVIPNNPTPLSPTPGTTTTIPDGDVPQTEIPDGETPLAATPAKTGDNLALWVLAAGVSGIGLVWVSLMGRKRRDEDGSQN